MILYIGKARDMTFKMLLYIAFWILARETEQLESVDFSRN